MRSTTRISVLGLVPYPVGTSPSQRFRIEQWAPELALNGIDVTLLSFADARLMEVLHRDGRPATKAALVMLATLRRVASLGRIHGHDVVLIHRAASLFGPALLERVIARAGRPIVFDFDDAIFRLHTSSANRGLGWLKFPGKTAALCRLASSVVVGNSYLAEYAGRYNDRVSIVPTSIDTDRYRPRPRRATAGRLVVGWTGSSTSQAHLEAFVPVLRRLQARHDVEIRVISNRPVQLPGVSATWRAWSAETEIDEIADFDIGIMPMPDDEWSKGKCALKLLQCMALGVPSVGSAVGANLDVIRHEENGLLARDEEEWLLALERLADDRELRIRLGRAGRHTVEQRFSMRRCAGLFADAVSKVAAGVPRRAGG